MYSGTCSTTIRAPSSAAIRTVAGSPAWSLPRSRAQLPAWCFSATRCTGRAIPTSCAPPTGHRYDALSCCSRANRTRSLESTCCAHRSACCRRQNWSHIPTWGRGCLATRRPLPTPSIGSPPSPGGSPEPPRPRSAGGAPRREQLELDVDRLPLGDAGRLLQSLSPGGEADHGPVAGHDPESECPVFGGALLGDELLLGAGEADVRALYRVAVAQHDAADRGLADVVVGRVYAAAGHAGTSSLYSSSMGTPTRLPYSVQQPS